jgi:hypothetical protein
MRLDIGAETFSFRNVLLRTIAVRCTTIRLRRKLRGMSFFKTPAGLPDYGARRTVFFLFFCGARWQVGDQSSATVARAAEKQKGGSWGRVVL